LNSAVPNGFARWFVLSLLILTGLACNLNAQKRLGMKDSSNIVKTESDFEIADLENNNWTKARQIEVGTYWSGAKAPQGRRFDARLLWSENALYVRFIAQQDEPLVTLVNPSLDSKTMNLWDRDVCEIFIAPDPKEPKKYFEFEVAPTGEWIDVALDLTSGKRETDWKYSSGMRAAAKVGKTRVVMAIKIPWTAFGKKPKAGDIWLGNLFRCVGKDPGRGYLAWQPTLTRKPAFHVPEKFGEFRFVG